MTQAERAVRLYNESHNLAVWIAEELGLFATSLHGVTSGNLWAGENPIRVITASADGIRLVDSNNRYSSRKEELASLLDELALVRRYQKSLTDEELSAILERVKSATDFVKNRPRV